MKKAFGVLAAATLIAIGCITADLTVNAHVIVEIRHMEAGLSESIPGKIETTEGAIRSTPPILSERIEKPYQDAAFGILERRLQINELLENGVLGEANDGFVIIRGAASGDAQKLADAENRDRASLYAKISTKAGADSAFVGRLYAFERLKAAKSGLWIQIPERGELYDEFAGTRTKSRLGRNGGPGAWFKSF